MSSITIAIIAATVSAIAASISAIAAAISSYITLESLRRARITDDRRMVLAAREEYASPQMLADLILLGKFQEQYPTNFSEKLVEGRKSIPEIIEVDNARRRVKTHYLKPVWLHRNKLISDASFYQMIDSRGINLLHEVVRPMTIATDNERNPEIADFDYLASRFNKLKWYKY